MGEPEIISIPEFTRRVGCSKETAYKSARGGEVPGTFGIGRLLRVNWSAFVSSTERSSGHELAEEGSSMSVPAGHHVGINAQSRSGVRVA